MPLNSKIILFLLIVGSLFGLNTHAQGILKGQVFDIATKTAIPKVKVANIKKQRSAIADSLGRFSIEAAPGDMVVYSAPGYLADTVYLVNLNTVKVYLQINQTQLNQVNVQSARTKLGNLAIKAPPGPFGGHTVVYTTDKAGNPVGGLTVKIPGTNGPANKREQSRKKIEREETQNAIAGIFSPQNLKNYLHIEGQELQNFAILYTPDVNTYQHNFNLALYVDSCYKEFLKIPIEKRKSKAFLELPH